MLRTTKVTRTAIVSSTLASKILVVKTLFVKKVVARPSVNAPVVSSVTHSSGKGLQCDIYYPSSSVLYEMSFSSAKSFRKVMLMEIFQFPLVAVLFLITN